MHRGKKYTRWGNFISPPPYTAKVACVNFGMCGRVLEVINHAIFQLDQFRGFEACQVAETRCLPLTYSCNVHATLW